MSLLRQLFRLKIDKYLPEELEELLFHLLLPEKHPPNNLLEDIKMLWFTPCDYEEGGGCVLECLEESNYCHTIEDYAENYRENFECRRAMAPLRSVKYLEDDLEEYSHISKRDYSVVKEAISDYPEYTGVDIVNIIRRLRNGELNFEILDDNDPCWSTSNLDLYDIDTTTLVIYKEELNINDKWINNIENFLNEHIPYYYTPNNENGFIWLASDEKEIYGRLIIKQEGTMNDNYWKRTGAEIFY